MDYLKSSYRKGELEFHGTKTSMGTLKGMKHLTDTLWQKKDWIVHIEPPLDRPDKVLEYLGRYTHRVAISNHRIVSLVDGNVTFTIKNRDTGRIERETITAVEFIRRFFLHVLPKRFMRIRHYGFLANRVKKENERKMS